MTGVQTNTVRNSPPSLATAFPKSFKDFVLLNGGNIEWAARIEAFGESKSSKNPVALKSLAALGRKAAVDNRGHDGETEAVEEVNPIPVVSDPVSLAVLGRQFAVYNSEEDEARLNLNPSFDPLSFDTLGRQVVICIRAHDGEAGAVAGPLSLATLYRQATLYNRECDDASLHPIPSSVPLSLATIVRQLDIHNREFDGEAKAVEEGNQIPVASDPLSLAVLGRQFAVYREAEAAEAAEGEGNLSSLPSSAGEDEVPILSLFNTSYNNSGNASPLRDGNRLTVARNTYGAATSPVVENPEFIAALEALKISGGNEGGVLDRLTDAHPVHDGDLIPADLTEKNLRLLDFLHGNEGVIGGSPSVSE